MKKHIVVITILSIGFFASCEKTDLNTETSSIELSSDSTISKTISGQFVPGELLVKFKAGTGEKSRIQTLSFIDGKVSEHILTPVMQSNGDNQGIYLINTTTDVYSAIARMKGESNIEYAEPNWIYTHTVVSNDPIYTRGDLWGMYGTPLESPDNFVNNYGSQANKAWGKGNIGSSNVYIGIIDEGYMYNHEDLAANAGTNLGEIANNGIDDDGNLLVDDVHGWDFANNDKTVFDGTGDDHGTHVAGTIGAKGGNGKGVAGVCWNVRLLNAKFLGQRGGTTANAIRAVDYFTDLKVRNNLNIIATNNSWGGGGFSQGLLDAIGRGANAGILFIAAAGNNTSDNDATNNYPSNYSTLDPRSAVQCTYDAVIAVASINVDGTLSYFSNWGSTQVDLGAPGSGIYSTVPASSKGKQVVSAYSKYSGTSMATPHVTGAAALYASTHPGSSAATIKAAILNSVTATPSLAGICTTHGRLNVSGF